CGSHLRFRWALKSQGRTTDELAYTSQAGIVGSIFGITLNFLVLIAQFWIALFPIGGKPEAESFFKSYLSFPIIIVFYVFHKIWKKNWRMWIPV
ncbi:hypothetical protein FK519_29990, partial [Klebsiella pneumoniae]|nr:hypothetical protein [Klebsiella pneumoniae]